MLDLSVSHARATSMCNELMKKGVYLVIGEFISFVTPQKIAVLDSLLSRQRPANAGWLSRYHITDPTVLSPLHSRS